jgi:hypothetical protein
MTSLPPSAAGSAARFETALHHRQIPRSPEQGSVFANRKAPGPQLTSIYQRSKGATLRRRVEQCANLFCQDIDIEGLGNEVYKPRLVGCIKLNAMACK